MWISYKLATPKYIKLLHIHQKCDYRELSKYIELPIFGIQLCQWVTVVPIENSVISGRFEQYKKGRNWVSVAVYACQNSIRCLLWSKKQLQTLSAKLKTWSIGSYHKRAQNTHRMSFDELFKRWTIVKLTFNFFDDQLMYLAVQN